MPPRDGDRRHPSQLGLHHIAFGLQRQPDPPRHARVSHPAGDAKREDQAPGAGAKQPGNHDSSQKKLVWYGSILTRSRLASCLFDNYDPFIHNSNILIELTLICGNDYVDTPALQLKKKFVADAIGDLDDILFDLNEDDSNDIPSTAPGAMVTNPIAYQIPNVGDDLGVRYVRALYDLDETVLQEEFPLIVGEEGTRDHHDVDADHEANATAINPSTSPRKMMYFPQRKISIDDILLQEIDQRREDDVSPLGRIATNCLQFYLSCADDQAGTPEAATPLNQIVIEQEHIDALHRFFDHRSSRQSLPIGDTLPRPEWKDVRAVHLIESCFVKYYNFTRRSIKQRGQEAMTSSLESNARANVRATIRQWDASEYHLMLTQIRQERGMVNLPDVADETDAQQMAATSTTKAVVNAPRPKPIRLPIDEHEDTILQTIHNNRITIIHGETGCGKSSRVPCMILRHPSPITALPNVRIFISQPRRIAAKSLVERIRNCEPDLKDAFALRMGHGWREYETSQTQALFVTTGYLTRYLA